jgi:hypothetical protein
MQPYFFPYVGHFALIDSVDEWIVFDVTQYTPKTWMNRNRILHPKTGWLYVTVPLANSSNSILTSEARVLDLVKTQQSILGKLSHYRKKAPYYVEVTNIVQHAFTASSNDSLVNLNVNALNAVCDYLQIAFKYQIASELPLDYPPDLGPGDWAPFICEKLGATEYVNPIGGRDLFDITVFQDRGISLLFADFTEFEYATTPYSYEPHLSILDTMMWNAPRDIVAALKSGTTLLEAT